MIASAPITVIVRAALSALGFRNAGTPLEIASTPVSAVQPDENARSASSAIAREFSPDLFGVDAVMRTLCLWCVTEQRADQADGDHQPSLRR